MTIVFATDNNFAQHCAVAIRSVLCHNKDVEFYILTEGLTCDNEHKLRCVADTCPLHICKVDSEAVKDMPMPQKNEHHITIATWYRLFITQLLPSSVDKVIYLDGDLIVRGSLRELWQTDIRDKALAAVYYPNRNYFNAGVLLLNLAYWRSHDLPKRYFDFISESQCVFPQRDQDVLNAVTGFETLALPWKYNAMTNELELIKERASGELLENIKKMEKDNPVIVHFSYRLKPWEFGCRNPYKSEYRQLLKDTPYCGASLHFSWFGFYYFWIIPIFIHPVIMFLKGKK